MIRVMIVDDAAFMRATIRRILEHNNYQVVAEAENGERAIELYKIHKPDVVSMDITMPEKNGIETLKEIKRIDPNARIIMVTAMGQDHLVRDAVISGAISFVVKPFSEAQFLSAFNQVAKNIL